MCVSARAQSRPSHVPVFTQIPILTIIAQIDLRVTPFLVAGGRPPYAIILLLLLLLPLSSVHIVIIAILFIVVAAAGPCSRRAALCLFAQRGECLDKDDGVRRVRRAFPCKTDRVMVARAGGFLDRVLDT